jgi:dihydrofolate reductase
MRRLIVGYLATLDGVHASPRSWAGDYFDAQAAEEALAQLTRSDAMLMGRTTYEYFAQAWPQAEGAYPDRINAIRKYVFSRTLSGPEWHNSVVVRTDPVAAVADLKRQGTGDLVIYGYGRLAQTLLENDLVDEVSVSLFPILHGTGETVARSGAAPRHLKLASADTLPTGVVSLRYVRQ